MYAFACVCECVSVSVCVCVCVCVFVHTGHHECVNCVACFACIYLQPCSQWVQDEHVGASIMVGFVVNDQLGNCCVSARLR